VPRAQESQTLEVAASLLQLRSKAHSKALQNESGVVGGDTSTHQQCLTLLGERNSGTTWIERHLKECFHGLHVQLGVAEFKHFFQWEDKATTDRRACSLATLTIARKPLEWTMAMQKRPWHSPSHLDVAREDWKVFVEKPWTITNFDSNDAICDDKVPCTGCAHQGPFSSLCPVYELEPGGGRAPYKSIVDLRADKLINFANVSTWLNTGRTIGVWYDDLLREGTGHMLARISALTGLEHSCSPSPPQPARLTTYKPYPAGFEEWMNTHINWEAEHIFDVFTNATYRLTPSAIEEWHDVSKHLHLARSSTSAPDSP
jgi:hypothetical protein